MGFVNESRDDAFISYAHDDDLAEEGRIGWVTHLKRRLVIELIGKLGKKPDVWMDHELQIGADFSQELVTRVRACPTFVLMLSPNYLRSPWGGQELSWFLEEVALRQERNARRLFVVELDRLDEKDIPAALQKPQRLPFWTPDPDSRHMTSREGYPEPNPTDPEHKTYYKKVAQLASDLSSALKDFKSAGDAGEGERAPPATGRAPRATVYLAETTEDVDPQYRTLRRALEDAKYEVLPAVIYPRAEAAFRAAALADMRRSQLYVQLYGTLPGRALGDSSQSCVPVQYECALEAFDDDRILRWRSDASPDQIADVDYRAWLEQAGVYRLKLEEFKGLALTRLVKLLEPPPPPPPETSLNKTVFINADGADLEVAGALGDVLSRLGVWVELPQKSEEAANPRDYLKQKLGASDALMIVYGKSPVAWVNGQFGLSRQILANPPRSIPFAVVEVSPPDQKDALTTIPPGLARLRGRPLPAEGDLAAYLRTL